MESLEAPLCSDASRIFDFLSFNDELTLQYINIEYSNYLSKCKIHTSFEAM